MVVIYENTADENNCTAWRSAEVATQWKRVLSGHQTTESTLRISYKWQTTIPEIIVVSGSLKSERNILIKLQFRKVLKDIKSKTY